MSDQNQSAGNKSIQVQADGGSTVNLNYSEEAKTEEADRILVVEILEHIFANQTVTPEDSTMQTGTDYLRDLKEKIELNFTANAATDVKLMFRKVWIHKNEIEVLLGDKEPEVVTGFVFDVQREYRSLCSSESCDHKMEDANHIVDLAKHYLPETHRGNSKALYICIAIILLVFEKCDIGKKTATETERANSQNPQLF